MVVAVQYHVAVDTKVNGLRCFLFKLLHDLKKMMMEKHQIFSQLELVFRKDNSLYY